MAFGAHELRLMLSIQSYGTGNIMRLRRDIMQLSNATRAANANQLAVQQAITKEMNRAQSIRNRIGTLERRQLSSQGISQFKARERVMKRLNELGYRGIVLQKVMAGQYVAQNAEARALVNTLWAQDAAREKIVSDIQVENAALVKSNALQKELNGSVMREAILRDAMIAKVQGLQEAEIAARTAQHVGRATQFAGLIGTAAFSLMGAAAASFSDNVTLAATQMRDLNATWQQSKERAKVLGDAILDMMGDFPASAEEMANAAYDIFSSMDLMHNGVMDVNKGLDLLEVANKVAVAGLTNLEEATNAMIVVLNNFDPTLSNVQGTMDTVFSIVRFGQMRLNDFAASMSKLAPIAATTGISLKDVGGAFATLTILNKDAQGAAFGLGRALELLRLPAFKKGLEAAGVAVEDATGRMRPLFDIFEDMKRVFPEMASGQKSVIEALIQISRASGMTKAGIQGTIQARRAIAQLITHMSLYESIQGKVNKNQGELNSAFKAMADQPGFQWRVLINNLKAFAIIVGQAALPALITMGQYLVDAADWFKNLDAKMRGTLIKFATFGSVALVLSGTVVSLVGSFKAMQYNLAIMNILSGQSVKKFEALRIVMGSFAFTGLFIALSAVIGIKRAVVDLTAAFIAWKVAAVISARSVAAANAAAAVTTETAWITALTAVKAAARGLLMATGFGAVAVLAGLAADYVMTHWDQVRAFFAGLQEALKMGWKATWDTIKGYAMIAIAEMEEQFYDFENKLIPGLGRLGRKIDEWTGFDVEEMKKNGQALIDSAGQIDTFRKTYERKMAEYDKARKAGNKKRANDLKKEIEKISAGILSGQFLENQNKYLDSLGELTNKEINMQKIRTNATQAGMKKQAEVLQQGVDNLINIYESLEDANKQAFGSFGQGPVMQGIFGGVFTGLNDLLRQFGVQIPIPFELIRRDFDMQLTYFKRWMQDLAKLRKRGLPEPLIEQIQAMGPAQGIPIAEGLLQGGKKGWNQLVKAWKDGQGMLDKQTQADLNAKLKYWKSFGNDAAYQMIMGIINNPKNKQLQKQFGSYIKNNFAKQLKDEFQKAFTEAVTQGVADAKAAAAAAGAAAGAGKPKPGKPAPKKTELQKAQEAQRRINKQYIAASKKYQYAAMWARNAQSPGGVKITPAERRRLDQLWGRRSDLSGQLAKANARVKKAERAEAAREADQKERAAIRRQRRSALAENPERTKITYHYGGEQVTIVTGASVNDVMKALDRKEQTKKNRRRNKKPRGHIQV